MHSFFLHHSWWHIQEKRNHDHRQTAGPGKKPTVMSTCSFIAGKNWNFCTYFQKALLPSKISDYVPARQPKFFRDIWEVFSVIQIHFANAYSSNWKCFVKRNVTTIFFLLIFSLFFSSLGIASLNFWENFKKILQQEFFFTKSDVFLLSCNNNSVNFFTGISHMLQSLEDLFLKI